MAVWEILILLRSVLFAETQPLRNVPVAEFHYALSVQINVPNAWRITVMNALT